MELTEDKLKGHLTAFEKRMKDSVENGLNTLHRRIKKEKEQEHLLKNGGFEKYSSEIETKISNVVSAVSDFKTQLDKKIKDDLLLEQINSLKEFTDEDDTRLAKLEKILKMDGRDSDSDNNR